MVDREIEQKQLAVHTGISISLLEKILIGNRRPTQRAIARLEAFFGQPIFSTPERKTRQPTLTLHAGDEIEFVTVEQAKAARPEVADYAILDGRILRFTREATFNISFPKTAA